MKLITIFQNNGPNIVMEDNDNSDLYDYLKEITKLLEFDNISVLHTSSSSVVIRPSKILSIHVEEIQSEKSPFNEEELEPSTAVVHKEEIDIITDGD